MLLLSARAAGLMARQVLLKASTGVRLPPAVPPPATMLIMGALFPPKQRKADESDD